MKLVFIIILFNSLLFSQLVEINAVVYSIVSGVSMSYQMKDRQAFKNGDPVYKEHQKKWRLLLPVEGLTLLNVGFSIALEDRKEKIENIITDVFVVGSIRWLVRDGIYQLMHDENFFKLPNTENTFFPNIEKLGSPFFKIFLVASVLAFKFLLLPLL